MREKILFLDFDDVLNSVRSLLQEQARYLNVRFTSGDFDEKWWGKGHVDNVSPHFSMKLNREVKKRKKQGLKMPRLNMENYPHDPCCIQNLNEIITENDPDIVICSTWRKGRTVEGLREILSGWGVNETDRVISKTPSLFDGNRGREIYEWLQKNDPNRSIKHVCILDDLHAYDIDWLFEGFTVKDIDGYKHGLRKKHVAEAREVFQKPFYLENIKMHT